MLGDDTGHAWNPERNVYVVRRLRERDEPCRYSSMIGHEECSRRVVETVILYSAFVIVTETGCEYSSPPTGEVGLLISSCVRRSKVSDTSRG